MSADRERDEYGRAAFRDTEIPPATEHYAKWRGRLTHPDAVVSGREAHKRCVGGWVASGEWWLNCGTCRPEVQP